MSDSAPVEPKSAQTRASDQKTPRSRAMRWVKRAAVTLFGVLVLAVVALLSVIWYTTVFPGSNHRGPLEPLTPEQESTAEMLRVDVERLAGEIGNRSIYRPKGLADAAAYVKGRFESLGYAVEEHSFVQRGTTVPNMQVVIPGQGARADEIIVVGAHIDTEQITPGADDNATGVAAILALADEMKTSKFDRTVRLVIWVNEELPTGGTPDMGSWVYAKKCRQRNEKIVVGISLESIGYYDDREGTQKYPKPLDALYPVRGDFVAFVGDTASRTIVAESVRGFRSAVRFPSEGAALPTSFRDIARSDHWAFWMEGYAGLMVTDTANFRNPHYHRASDTPDTVNYEKLARVVTGLRGMIEQLARSEQIKPRTQKVGG